LKLVTKEEMIQQLIADDQQEEWNGKIEFEIGSRGHGEIQKGKSEQNLNERSERSVS
jgi:hypothetical protein